MKRSEMNCPARSACLTETARAAATSSGVRSGLSAGPPGQALRVTVCAGPDSGRVFEGSQPTAVAGRLGVAGLVIAGVDLIRLFRVAQKRGFDIHPERLSLRASAPVAATASAQQAATGADIVLLAVRNKAQLEDALYGPNGVAVVLAPGSTILLTSTVGIDAVREVAGRLAADGLHLVDAPISGGPVAPEHRADRGRGHFAVARLLRRHGKLLLAYWALRTNQLRVALNQSIANAHEHRSSPA